MKLSDIQKARLSALLKLPQADLSDAELEELDFLASLAKRTGEIEAIRAEAREPGQKSEPQKPEPQAADPVNPDDADAKPSILDQARGLASSNGKLIAQNRELTQANGTFKAENAKLAQELEAIRAERDALAKEKAELTAVLSETKAKVKTIEAATVDQLAVLGVPEASLPGTVTQAAADQPQTEAELEEALAKERKHSVRIQMQREFKARKKAEREAARKAAAMN